MARWIHHIALCMTLLTASQAHADISAGDARLFVDTELFNYERATIEKYGEREIETQYDVGPAGSAVGASLPGFVGLGLGYALHRHVVTALHFSFARHQSTHERYFDESVQPQLREPTVTSFMLRPELEIPFNPAGGAVFGLLVACDFRKSSAREELSNEAKPYERTAIAFGPVAGVVTHLFVVEQASVDLAALVIVDFVDVKGDDPWADAARYRDIAFNLTLGLSLWP